MLEIDKLKGNVEQACADFSEIKEAIEGNGVVIPEGTATSELPSYVNNVFDAGKEAVLKAFTNNYTRKDFAYAFFYTDFSGYTFPKTMVTGCPCMFQYYAGEYLPSGFDLTNTTVNTSSGQWFCRSASKLKYFPDINYPAQTRYGGAWQSCSELETIEVVRSNENTLYDSAFGGCYKLKNITFEGVIGQNISFDTSTKLTAESIANIVEHLSDTSTGKTLTLKQWSVNNADWSKTDYANWNSLIATKTNWTFSLV